jgi:hypothetical protein
VQTAVPSIPTTDHAATGPQEDIEMLKIAHLGNAMKMLAGAMGFPARTAAHSTPSIPTEPRVVPMNSLGNIDDPNDLPHGDMPDAVTAAEDVIDPRSAPLVSLGQGAYARDIFIETPAPSPKPASRSANDLAMSAVYIQCSKMARLAGEVLNVTDIRATMSLRVVGTISKPLAAYLNEPAEPAAFSCHKVYLGRCLHEQILIDFARKLYARGVEPGRVRFMVETLNAALSPIHMDAIDDEELASISDAALAARGLPNS